MSEKKHWSVLETNEIFKNDFFRLRSEKCQLPEGKVMPSYFTLDFPDWVNVVALTHSGEMILVRQYRHAIGKMCLEIPGGSTHPGQNEDPLEAARRELLEETGYVPREIRLIGKCMPNPALQSNYLWSYLALGCEKLQAQNLDPYEEIDVVTLPFARVEELIQHGEIASALVVQAIHLALPLLG